MPKDDVSLVSFLCGMFAGRSKAPDPEEEVEKREDNADSSTTDDATTKPISSGGGPESPDQQQLPLPPPPGAGHHMRTVSCQPTRSTSGVSRLVSRMSLRVGCSGGGIGEKLKNKDHKKFKHEDSVWKKTIILGEKCRVPDEDDDHIFYDEKGNRISTFHHPKTQNSTLPISRQTSF